MVRDSPQSLYGSGTLQRIFLVVRDSTKDLYAVRNAYKDLYNG